MQLSRSARRTASSALGRAMDLGMLPYRRIGPVTGDDWDAEYATSDELAYFGELRESPRYGVLVGFLRHFGRDADIVDLGCGTALLRTQMDGIDFRSYTGIDISPRAIAHATAAGYENSSFVVGTIPERGPYDVVIANEVLYYLQSPATDIAALRAVLRPGGHLLVSVYHHRGFRGLLRLVDAHFEEVVGFDVANLRPPHDRHRLAVYRAR